MEPAGRMSNKGHKDIDHEHPEHGKYSARFSVNEVMDVFTGGLEDIFVQPGAEYNE